MLLTRMSFLQGVNIKNNNKGKSMSTLTLKKLAQKTVLLLASGVLISGLAVAHQSKKAPEWLFVMTAKHGEITVNSKGQHTLTLKDRHMSRVLAFTDRPERYWKDMTVKQLKSDWSKGADSFAQDPPNAVITINGQSQPVVITGIQVTRHSVKFALKPDGNYIIKPDAGATAVFIDSLLFPAGPRMPGDWYSVWPNGCMNCI